MNNLLEDPLVVGCFGRVHGLKGFIVVHSFTEPRDNLLQYHDWHFFWQGLWKPLHLLQVQAKEKHILVKVKGWEERETVQALTNAKIAVDKRQLPTLQEGEYYWHELIGKSVINFEHETLGKVKDLLRTGAQDVLVIEGKKRYLIPFLYGKYIHCIDAQQIQVDWDTDF